jgi:hypothetical protein
MQKNFVFFKTPSSGVWPNQLPVGTGFLARGKSDRGVKKVTIHLLVVPVLRRRGAIPLLAICAFMA